uniref:NADH dehydrogenase subunit 6 n=1 Tax=Platorchestia parapacifica TaxID=1395100 RepID=A0A343SA12_9CRUS|nr:NADH dehydrogenase subunit 6 [Platorchestia parapacifica]
MLFLLSLIIYTSLLFTQLTSPLSMGLSIIFLAATISVLIFNLIPSSWFSFLLIMIFLSGMMIIFIYISSLAANEILFHINNMFIIPIIIYMVYIYNQTNILTSNNNFMFSLFPYSFEMMYKVYTPSIYLFTVFLIIYLLLALIVVVKNSSMKQAPLRMK